MNTSKCTKVKTYKTFPLAPCRNITNFSLFRGDQKVLTCILQCWPMRNSIFNHKKITKTFISKIILHNYVLYKGHPSEFGIFTANQGMALIFTDFPLVMIFQQEVGPHHMTSGKSVNIRAIPWFAVKIPTSLRCPLYKI